MWRILLIAVLFTLFSCNDGDITVDTFDFTNSTTQACFMGTPNFFMYRINNSEVLIIRMPENHLANPTTPLESPNELVPLSVQTSGIDVIYRVYNGPLTNNVICNPIAPPTPIVAEQWLASSGNIRVTTNVSRENLTYMGSPNATRIRGFNHEIQFQNITFNRPNGVEQFYETLPFGSFQTQAVNQFPNFTGPVLRCFLGGDRILLYKNIGNQILQVNLPQSLFPNQNTNNEPRRLLISEQNFMQYLIFQNPVSIGNNAFCDNTILPIETWNAREGIDNVSGIIEVETTQNAEGFRHTVRLKRIVFNRGNIEFTLGDNWEMGSFFLN